MSQNLSARRKIQGQLKLALTLLKINSKKRLRQLVKTPERSLGVKKKSVTVLEVVTHLRPMPDQITSKKVIKRYYPHTTTRKVMKRNRNIYQEDGKSLG